MSYQVKLYTCNDDTKKVNKNITLKNTITGGRLRDDDTLQSNQLSIYLGSYTVDDFVSNNINYVYIPKMKRYYFVDYFRADHYQELYIVCTEDDLMSFSTDINNLTCYVDRNEFTYNKSIVDNSYPTTSKRNVSVRNIGTLGNSNTYVLTTSGGGF